MTPAPAIATETHTPDILAETTCLLVRFHKTGLLRKGDMSLVHTETDKDRLRLRKEIIKSDSYDHMMLIARDCRRYIKARELPSPFGQGSHLIARDLVEEIDAKVSNAIGGYNNWANQFVAEYPTKKEEARASLKDQFLERNYYDSMDSLRSMFWIERHWFDFSPSSSSKVGDVIADREHQRSADETKDLYNKVKAALRVSLKKLTSHLVGRLTPGPDGTRKQFAASTIDKVVEWLQIFSKRNVANDQELAMLANKAQGILEGVSIAELKTDADLAATVATQMGEVDQLLGKLVQDCDSRALALEDDEDE